MTDLTVAEAAAVAGVSVRTVRRWIASGQVVTIGRGQRKRVVAASLSKPAATNGQDGHQQQTAMATETANTASSDKADSEAGHLAILVRELSERLADQTALTAIWQERARVLGDQLALAAPQQPQETVLDASGAMETPDPSGEPAPQPEAFPAPIPPTPNERPWLLGPGLLRSVVVLVGVAIVLMMVWWLGH